MECMLCKCKMEENMVLLASPGGKVRLVKELGRNKYKKGEMYELNACICPSCGRIELFVKS